MSVVRKLNRFFVRFPHRLKTGIRKSAFNAAEICFQLKLVAPGRFFLWTILPFVREENVTYYKFYDLVRKHAKLLNAPATKRLLFSRRASAPSFGPVLRTTYELASGNIDAFVECAKEDFRLFPSNDVATLHKLESNHYRRDHPASRELLSRRQDLAQRRDFVGMRIKRFAATVGDTGIGRQNIDQHLESIRRSQMKPPVRRLQHIARLAVNNGDFDIAKRLIDAEADPLASMLIRKPQASTLSSLVIHLHHAVNQHLGLHRETGHFAPAHYDELLFRDQQSENELINKLRDRLRNDRDQFVEPEFIPIAFFCPVHRSNDIRSILQQAKQQSVTSGITYLILNNLDQAVDEAWIRQEWASEKELRIFNFGEMPGLGSVIDRTLPLIDEPFMLKFDADSLYGPNYAADMMGQLKLNKADVCVKRAKFVDEYDIGLTSITSYRDANRWYANGDWAGGSALIAPTDIWRRFSQSKAAVVGEDTSFLRSAYHNGKSIYFCDPFNHISVQSINPDNHTFKKLRIDLAEHDSGYPLGMSSSALRELAFI